jgi:hypothetical protein
MVASSSAPNDVNNPAQQNKDVKSPAALGMTNEQPLQQSKDAKSPAASGVTNEQPLLSNPNHTAHDLYRQVMSGIDRLPQGTFENNDEKQRVAAVMTVEVAKAGLKNVDHIMLSNDGKQLFAIGGGLNNPAHIRVNIDVTDALGQPIKKSSMYWFDLNDVSRRKKQQDDIEDAMELQQQRAMNSQF